MNSRKTSSTGQKTLKPALWLQAAAMSGFIMTAMFLVLSLFPIIDVPRPLVFTVKIGGFVLACQLGAAALFYSYRRRSHACLGADLGSDNVEVIEDATGATTFR